MRLAGGERIATSTVNTAFSSLSGSLILEAPTRVELGDGLVVA